MDWKFSTADMEMASDTQQLFPLEYFLEDIEVRVDLKKKFPEKDIEFFDSEKNRLEEVEIVKDQEMPKAKLEEAPAESLVREPKEDVEKPVIEERKAKIVENKQTDTLYLCTLVSEKTFIKGITLYNSLRRHSDSFHMWIICLDAISYSVIRKLKLDNCTVVHVSELGDYNTLEGERAASGDDFHIIVKQRALKFISKKYGNTSVKICEPDVFYYSGYSKDARIFEYDDIKNSEKFLGARKDNEIYLGEERIYAFKFTEFEIINDIEFNLISRGVIPQNSRMFSLVYIPYIKALVETIRDIRQRGMLKMDGFFCETEVKYAENYYKYI